MWNKIKEFMQDERGITSVEIILILVILIGLVLIFKEQMTALVKGNIPQEMEDKWFWYYEDGKLVMRNIQFD